MKYKWLNELPQAIQNKLTALIKAYCKKILDIMYLNDDEYMVQITNILKPYI